MIMSVLAKIASPFVCPLPEGNVAGKHLNRGNRRPLTEKWGRTWHGDEHCQVSRLVVLPTRWPAIIQVLSHLCRAAGFTIRIPDGRGRYWGLQFVYTCHYKGMGGGAWGAAVGG